jgi:hypothetical protein
MQSKEENERERKIHTGRVHITRTDSHEISSRRTVLNKKTKL